VRVRGRAADVVARVMSATAHELGRVGYAALRIEDVATRSGVNKTTVYRRWPSKTELIAEAIARHAAEALGQRADSTFDTGTLRGDLRASLLLPFDLSPAGLGMLRVVQTERSVPEIDAITRRMRDHVRRMRVAIVKRAIARGELPKGVDAQLVVDLVSAPVQSALLFNERPKASYIDRVIDVVLAGAIATCTKRPRRR
jgi:AcrR family transcriptional regulator